MTSRPRRLRHCAGVREMARETRLSEKSLVLPLFVKEGRGIKEPITSMEGQFRYSPDLLPAAVDVALEAGVTKFLLFGLPAQKDDRGSGAYADDGIAAQAIRAIRQRYGNKAYIITDVCMCAYTSHGHCGVFDGVNVDNDKSLPFLADIARSHAEAGADMVAPSDMMDGRVRAIRKKLDECGCCSVPIMSYSAKYASSFYGPFREAAVSAPGSGDRKAYQMAIASATADLPLALPPKTTCIYWNSIYCSMPVSVKLYMSLYTDKDRSSNDSAATAPVPSPSPISHVSMGLSPSFWSAMIPSGSLET